MKKTLKIVGIVVVIVFVIYNIIWTSTINKIYDPFKKAIGGNVKNEGGYTYGVTLPKYLSYEGNISISEDINVKDDGFSDATSALIIWPLRNGEYRYGVTLFTGTKDGNSVNYGIDLYLDENMNLAEQYGKEEIEMYEKFLPKIKILYDLAEETWGIGK